MTIRPKSAVTLTASTAATGYELVLADYRLSPEFYHPAQLDDVEDSPGSSDIAAHRVNVELLEVMHAVLG